MKNPLYYFENLLSADLSEEKKNIFISDSEQNWNYNITKIDRENGIIEQELKFYDKYEDMWHFDTGISSFKDSFKNEIDREYKEAIKLLSQQILEISSKSISPEMFITQIKNKTLNFKRKSEQYYSAYPFVKEALIKIDEYLTEYSINTEIRKSANITIPNISIVDREQANYATLAITNYSSLSFKWDLINPNDVESALSRLYGLLTSNPPLIQCDRQDFINGFSQREVVTGINWKVMAKSKTCSKGSLIYLLLQLIEKCDLMDEPDDFNKKVEYVFRDHLGERLSNIKQSKSQMSDNPAQKERIDEIIESFLQA